MHTTTTKDGSLEHQSADSDQKGKSRGNRLRPWIVATAVIVFGAAIIRLALSFRHSLLPGMDAAYYPMQSLWLIEHGELSLPAMPLTFYLQAFLAKAIMLVSGTSLEHAVSLSARLFDGCIPPLTAIPIMLLGFRWSAGRRTAIWLCAAAAVFSVMSPPIMRMAGDLQKNSLGMMWMAVCIWAMRESLACPRSVSRWACLAAVFVLAGVSHIGAFGTTCVILACSMLGYAALTGRLLPKRDNALVAGKAILAAVVVTLFVAWLVPSQVQRIGTTVARVIGFSPGLLALSVVVYAVLTWVLRKLYLESSKVPRCDMAIAIGAACGIAVLVAPVFSGVWAMRFPLMTAVPAAALLSLAATKLRWDGAARWRQNAILAVIGLLALASPVAMQGPVISEAAANELRQLKTVIANPVETMVVAPHGIEFWAGYLMRTRVKSGSIPREISSYDRVLFLKPSDDVSGRRPPPQPNGNQRRRGLKPSDQMQPPAQEFELVIPPAARVVQRTKFFTLYELAR